MGVAQEAGAGEEPKMTSLAMLGSRRFCGPLELAPLARIDRERRLHLSRGALFHAASAILRLPPRGARQRP